MGMSSCENLFKNIGPIAQHGEEYSWRIMEMEYLRDEVGGAQKSRLLVNRSCRLTSNVLNNGLVRL